MREPLITVFTPTYNRADCINRVYESLEAQTFRDFEWLVVDDGSGDGTESVMQDFAASSSFPVRYERQTHAGKHVAWNRAVRHARGKFFVTADSDDAFLPESLEVLLEMWDTVAEDGRGGAFRGVACRCYSGNGRVVGTSSVPDPYVDATVPDAVFVHGFNYEMWGMNVTAVLREYPMPEVEGLRFYPEIILWDRMSERYMTRYFDTPLRIIYDDQENKTTTKAANTRYRENYYLWLHYLNDLWAYFGKSPKAFLKAAVGVIRDGLLSERRLGDVLLDIGPAPMRALALAGLPVAWVLAKTGK